MVRKVGTLFRPFFEYPGDPGRCFMTAVKKASAAGGEQLTHLFPALGFKYYEYKSYKGVA